MNFFSDFSFYTFIASAVFVCGIGLERLYIHSRGTDGLYTFIVKNAVSTIITVTLLWLFDRYVLKPIGAGFLLPVFIITVLVFQSFLFKRLFPEFTVTVEEENVFGYGLVFFVLYETASYFEALSVIFSSYLILFVFSYILHAVNQKSDDGCAGEQWKAAPLALIGLGFMVLVFSLIDSAWFFNID